MQHEPGTGLEERCANASQALSAAATSLASALELRGSDAGSAASRSSRIKELALAALASLDVFDREDEHGAATPEARGSACNVRGQALALLDRTLEAEEALTRAVKLCPTSSQAWNTLGELAWKRGDLRRAHTAFTSASAKCTDAQSLRNLSGIARAMAQGAATPSEQQALVSDSVAHAKAAVALNVGDGSSWYQLAMALMAHAFAHGRTRAADLAAANKAFAHAARNGAARDADMCFNRGVLLRFLDDIQGALDCFRDAGALDSELPWQLRVDELCSQATRVHDLVSTRGRLKPKRVVEVCNSLRAMQPPAGHASIAVHALSPDVNDGGATLCTIVALASTPGAVPLVVAAVDSSGEGFALSAFGVQDASLREGTTVAVLSPSPVHVRATLPDGRQLAYTVVRVEGVAMLRCWHNGDWKIPQAQRQTPSVRFQV